MLQIFDFLRLSYYIRYLKKKSLLISKLIRRPEIHGPNFRIEPDQVVLKFPEKNQNSLSDLEVVFWSLLKRCSEIRIMSNKNFCDKVSSRYSRTKDTIVDLRVTNLIIQHPIIICNFIGLRQWFGQIERFWLHKKAKMNVKTPKCSICLGECLEFFRSKNWVIVRGEEWNYSRISNFSQRNMLQFETCNILHPKKLNRVNFKWF